VEAFVKEFHNRVLAAYDLEGLFSDTDMGGQRPAQIVAV